MKRHINRSFLIPAWCVATVISCNFPVNATVYYIDQSHPGANDQNTGTSSLPWKTLTKANGTLVAGDTVFIKAGTYHSSIAPKNSGTAKKPIVYCNSGTDSVVISDTVRGIDLNSKSYIHVLGMHCCNLDDFLYIQNGACHNKIAYCSFDKGRNMGWAGSVIVGNSRYNRIDHCRFSNYRFFDANPRKCLLDIGDEESHTDSTQYNLVENSIFYNGGHHEVGLYGMYNVIRNNYMHNEASENNSAPRNMGTHGYTASSGWNLIERNRFAYSGIPASKWNPSGIQVSNSYNIIRRNLFYFNSLAGIQMSVSSTYYADVVDNKIYSNTFFHNGWNPPDGAFCPDAMCSAIGAAVYSGTLIIKRNSFRNNLFYDHPQSFGYYRTASSDQSFAVNWSGDTMGDPLFVKASKTPGDPMDTTYPDLHLKPNSACKDAGTYLTTITSASGSGSTFTVADSRYFMDGWGIEGVSGDDIRLFQSDQSARIVTIDYTAHSITVATSISWKKDQGVCLAYEGTGPDVGAFEIAPEQKVKCKRPISPKIKRKDYPVMHGRVLNIPDPKAWHLCDLNGRDFRSNELPLRLKSKGNGIIIAYSADGRTKPLVVLK